MNVSFDSSFDGIPADASIAQQALTVIVSYIRTEKLREGDLLPSADFFVEKYGFSRVMVREAMCYLKGMGIVISGKGSGFRLAKINPMAGFGRLLPFFFALSKDSGDIILMRNNMELGSFPSVVRNITDADLLELEKIVDTGRQVLRKDVLHNVEFIAVDTDFHTVLNRVSGNELLIAVTEYYQMKLGNATAKEQIADEIHRSILATAQMEHEQILNALKLKSPESGLIALYNHVKRRYHPSAILWEAEK